MCTLSVIVVSVARTMGSTGANTQTAGGQISARLKRSWAFFSLALPLLFMTIIYGAPIAVVVILKVQFVPATLMARNDVKPAQWLVSIVKANKTFVTMNPISATDPIKASSFSAKVRGHDGKGGSG